MRKLLFITLLSALLISCNSPDVKRQDNTKPEEALELVDIRIYEDGYLNVNGSKLSETALESHLDALDIDSKTKVRVTSSDEVYTGLVHRTLREFAERRISNVDYNMMSKEEFKAFENALIIDVLNNGKIMMDGNLLFPDDLAVALRNYPKPAHEITAKLHISDLASFGSVTDIQKILLKNQVKRISYSDTQS